MTERTSRIVAAAGLVLLLAAANLSVWKHERTLAEGRMVLLELAPVDPRSLMQGDYMALRFRVGDAVRHQAHSAQGRMVLAIGPDGVGSFRRVHRGEALAADEQLVEYRVRDGRERIVTDAYFFQEGQGSLYSGARYGELRVRPDGQALLFRLRDASKAPLGVPRY